MKKKFLMKATLAVLLLAALGSCKKEEAVLPNVESAESNLMLSENESGSKNDAIDPNVTIQAMENLYGDNYDFDSKLSANVLNNGPRFFAVPSYSEDFVYLTFGIKGDGRLLCVYETELGYNSTDTCTYKINDVEHLSPLLKGKLYLDTALGDWLTVESLAYGLPYYHYHLFDNIALGLYSLENISTVTITPSMIPMVLTLKSAATFYTNFQGS